jgi:hypothetical protein
MVNGALNLLPRPHDLGFENGDTRFQLGDGQRIEILAHEHGQGIVGTGEGVIRVHCVSNVDPRRRHVNNARNLGR